MVIKKRWLFVILASILAFSLLPACAVESIMTTPTPEPTPKLHPIPVEEVSLKEAAKVLGAPVPMPAYLPPGYELKRIYIAFGDACLFYSDEEIRDEVLTLQDIDSLVQKMKVGAAGAPKLLLIVESRSEMPPPDFADKMVKQAEGWGSKVVDINEVEEPLPAETVSVVDINQVKGYLSSGETSYALAWFLPGFHFDMRMPKELTIKEAIKIAQSIG